MDVRFQSLAADGLDAVDADALVVVLQGKAQPKTLTGAVGHVLSDAVKHGDFEFKSGSRLYVHRPAGVRAPRLAFVTAADGTAKAMKAAVATGLALLPQGVKHAAVASAGGELPGDTQAEALASAAAESVYLYRHTKPTAAAPSTLARVTMLGARAQATAAQRGVTRGQGIAAGVLVARELANRPANHCTPTDLGNEAQRIGKRYGMKVEVFGPKEIEKLGMGSFLAVAQGSAQPPRFIVMHYQGARKKDAAPHVIVGKGITFDTGGISIKPALEMDEMKFDMGGAASVLGTMTALGELKAKVNVVGIVPTCENMPAGNAVKPGDVVTSLSGQTIEILNTDAEGRLILCDALTYAERFKPASVVDIATLTGACVIALGHHNTGLFSPDDKLAESLLKASREAIDPAWRMPLDEEYDEGLKSHFADIPNIAGRAGGAITAAMFLKRFTSKYRWAHLDVAGTAWKTGTAKGATGRPVGLLTHYLLAQAR